MLFGQGRALCIVDIVVHSLAESVMNPKGKSILSKYRIYKILPRSTIMRNYKKVEF